MTEGNAQEGAINKVVDSGAVDLIYDNLKMWERYVEFCRITLSESDMYISQQRSLIG